MKNYLIVGIIVLLGLGGIWILAHSSEDQASQTADSETTEPQTPEAFDAQADTPEVSQYSSHNSSLSLSHPADWSATEGAENSAQEELITFESAPDANGFYFCLDLNGRHNISGTGELPDFTIENVTIKDIGQLNEQLESVIFTILDVDGLLWGVSDGTTLEGDDNFTNSLVSTSGSSQVQVTGRFNCRESDKPELTVDEFKNSRLFNEAQTIVESLTF